MLEYFISWYYTYNKNRRLRLIIDCDMLPKMHSYVVVKGMICLQTEVNM